MINDGTSKQLVFKNRETFLTAYLDTFELVNKTFKVGSALCAIYGRSRTADGVSLLHPKSSHKDMPSTMHNSGCILRLHLEELQQGSNLVSVVNSERSKYRLDVFVAWKRTCVINLFSMLTGPRPSLQPELLRPQEYTRFHPPTFFRPLYIPASASWDRAHEQHAEERH